MWQHEVFHLHVCLLSSGTLLLYRDLKEGAITGKVWNENPLVTPAISYTSEILLELMVVLFSLYFVPLYL